MAQGNSSWRLLMAVPMLAFGLTTVAHAQLNPAALTFQTPDQIKWRDPANKEPNNGASIHGNPDQPGFYVNLTKWNKGNNFSKPHSHPADRFITVLGGTWWMGTGTAWDRDSSVPMKAGTFVNHFAKGIHWDGAKDEDALLMIVGMGVATSTPATETQGKMGALNTTAVTYKTPDQMVWRDPANASPTNQTILAGDPTKQGVYVYLNKFKPGSFSRPHFHPNDRFITVVKGTWWVGTGTKFDPATTVPMKEGTIVKHFGNQVHYDGAKDEEVTVLIVGEGPATSKEAEQK